MHFDLENSWLDCSIFDNINQLDAADIADTDAPYKAFFHELLHSLPSLLVGDSMIRLHAGILS